MWAVPGTPMTASWLKPEPTRILYEFDGPRIFLCEDIPGNAYLAYQCGEDRTTLRFLVVPCGEDAERRLATGKTNVRDALSRPKAWILDLGYDWTPRHCWKVEVDDLPSCVLPKQGVMLYSHLPSLISQAVARAGSAETVIHPPSFPVPALCFRVA